MKSAVCHENGGWRHVLHVTTRDDTVGGSEAVSCADGVCGAFDSPHAIAITTNNPAVACLMTLARCKNRA